MSTMKSSALPALAFLAVVQGVCHNYERGYYEEIGCKVQTKDKDGCPTSYDCNMLKGRNNDKCHYQGLSFDQGHKLEKPPVASCLVECWCQKEDSRSVFNCVNIECPEFFGQPVKPNCYRIYEQGSCCSTDTICVDPAEQREHKAVCEYAGESYQVGQKFYPDNTCLKCICQPGFNGSLVEPFCQKIQCNLELVSGDRIHDGCVPVYYGDKGCCPIDWRCPEDTDKVVSGDQRNAAATNQEDSCKFGNVTMKIGDKLSPSEEHDDTVECTCRVPPHPVCIQKPYSQ